MPLLNISARFIGPKTKGDEIKDPARVKSALECLRKARKAEESGLTSLQKILKKI